MRGDIHQQAAGPADRRLERLIGRARAGALSRVEQRLLDHRQPAARACHLRLRQQQPGAGPDQVVGERRQPPLDRRRFAAQIRRPCRSAARSAGRPRSSRPAAIAWRIASSASPRSSYQAAAFRCSSPGTPALLLQAGAEQVGEQLVIAPPAAHLIQRHQEQSGPLHLLQQRLAAGAAGDRVAQRPADSRSSTEVSSKNARTCSLWRSSTSSAR